MTTQKVLPRLCAVVDSAWQSAIEPVLAPMIASTSAAGAAASTKPPLFSAVTYGCDPTSFAQQQLPTNTPVVYVIGHPAAASVIEATAKTAQQNNNKLLWCHSLYTGVDAYNPAKLEAALALHRSGQDSAAVRVTNARGVFSEMLAQHVLLSTLFFTRQVPLLQANRRSKKWDRFPSPSTENMKMAIVGYGEISRVCAKRAIGGLGIKAQNVVGIRSASATTPKPPYTCQESGATVVFGIDSQEGAAALSQADIVLAVLPATPETENTFDKKRFTQQMKKGAIFINIGRGSTQDEDALAEALQCGHLGGAAIDVFRQEPLPESSPLWNVVPDERMLLTPHNADISGSLKEDAAAHFCELARQLIDTESGSFDLEKLAKEMYCVDLKKGF